jgi:hypothetical protein
LKKSTISCQAGWGLVLFFRKAGKPDWRFPCAARDQGFGVMSGDDSGMAPQDFEIAQNGLGNSAGGVSGHGQRKVAQKRT